MAAANSASTMFAPARHGLSGRLAVPADKSISHRAAMVAAICDSTVRIHNFLRAADTLSTLSALRTCGVGIEEGGGGTTVVRGVGLGGFCEPGGTIDVGNSGTTMRLLPGILAGQSGRSFTLDGDESIRRRPMDRIVAPLQQMGVRIAAREGRFAPLEVTGGEVRAISYRMPMASAQVKSAVLLAGMYGDAPTEVAGPAVCRDHTERMLAAAGARVEKEGLFSRIYPVDKLMMDDIEVPGDLSSAAFFLVAASIVPGSEVVLEGVGVNPTRTGIIDILLEMGARIEVAGERLQGGEPVADLTVRSAALRGVKAGAGISGRAIDELPLVALAGACASGDTVVSGAAELRVKESDRIGGLVANLQTVGVDIEAREDGFVVHGGGAAGGEAAACGLRGGAIRSFGDHRMAMLGAIAGLASREGVDVEGFDCVAVSYPGFREDLLRLAE